MGGYYAPITEMTHDTQKWKWNWEARLPRYRCFDHIPAVIIHYMHRTKVSRRVSVQACLPAEWLYIQKRYLGLGLGLGLGWVRFLLFMVCIQYICSSSLIFTTVWRLYAKRAGKLISIAGKLPQSQHFRYNFFSYFADIFKRKPSIETEAIKIKDVFCYIRSRTTKNNNIMKMPKTLT